MEQIEVILKVMSFLILLLVLALLVVNCNIREDIKELSLKIDSIGDTYD